MDSLKMNEEQALALTTFIQSFRPDWKMEDIMTGLRVASRTKSLIDIAHATIRYAADRKNQNGVGLSQGGAHWQLPWKEPDRTPPRELWCIEHDCGENACKGQHVRKPPPPGWRDHVNRSTDE